MRLAHLHVRRLLPYHEASTLQERLIQAQFRHKDLVQQQKKNLLAGDSTSVRPPPPPPQAPPPTILTFSTPPTYTVGRRYLPSLSSSSPTNTSSPPSPNPTPSPYTLTPPQIATLTGHPNSLATFSPSPRGGLLTYHGPGQLTAYPILNLRTHGLTPNCYVRALEEAVMRTCAAVGVRNVTRTGDPGVWIDDADSAAGLPAAEADAEADAEAEGTNGEGKEQKQQARKICAVGVQIRRGITGHGVGLNVVDAEAPAEYTTTSDGGAGQGGYLSWGFGRIVACGLEGKGVTWLGREGLREGIGVEEVADVFVRELARGLDGVDGVDRIAEEDVQ